MQFCRICEKLLVYKRDKDSGLHNACRLVVALQERLGRVQETLAENQDWPSCCLLTVEYARDVRLDDSLPCRMEAAMSGSPARLTKTAQGWVRTAGWSHQAKYAGERG